MNGIKTAIRPRIWLLSLILALGLVLGAKPAWYAWQDLSFYWTERSETELLVKAYAEEMGISIGRYPKSLIRLLERNPETQEFVLHYPFRDKSALPVLESAEPDEIPLLLQWDPRWGYETYGSDFLAITGCGPTCLAMAGRYVTGDDTMTPLRIARFAEKNGYYAAGYGSSWTLISQGGPELGFTVTELPLVKKKIVDALESNCPVILAMGPGDFTTTGHYILLTGVENDAFRVNDPNSPANSQRLWTYEELEDQIRNIWKISD